MAIRQLSLRGKPKASAEWAFACAVHNLLKAFSVGNLTSPDPQRPGRYRPFDTLLASLKAL